MDFDRLTTLIIILIIWGVSTAFSRVAKANKQKNQTPGEKASLFQLLQQNLATLEEKDKGEEVLEFDEYLHPATQPLADQHKMESLIERAEGSLPQEPPIPGRVTVSASPPAEITKPRPTIFRKGPCVSGINRRKLQNAVIWAEILAPPVALRDQ